MEFRKLEQNGNVYNSNRRRSFSPVFEMAQYVEIVFEFAYGMTFGNQGKHRDHRTGGQTNRKNGELFINAFQGKLAEFGLYVYFTSKGLEINVPELGMWGEGIWDDEDLKISDKKISVKSCAFFSDLLLLETQDWSLLGEYIPNLVRGNSTYNYFILIRIKPDGKKLLRDERLYYSESVEKTILKKTILNEKWEIDIPGFITHEELKYLISEKYILPQNALLNGKISMDAQNYYCQSGDLSHIDLILPLLKIL